MQENFVVRLIDEHLPQSFTRIAEYYGQKETNGSECANKYLRKVKHDRYGELMHDNSEKWQDFMQHNKYNLKLYEYARSLFRAHAQTILSFEKQIPYKTTKMKMKMKNNLEFIDAYFKLPLSPTKTFPTNNYIACEEQLNNKF